MILRSRYGFGNFVDRFVWEKTVRIFWYVCWLSRSDQGNYEFLGLLLVCHNGTNLHLIFEKIKFEKSSWMNLIFVHFKLDFYCLRSLQNSCSKYVDKKNQVHPTWFFILDFLKIKCRSIGGEYKNKQG